MMMPFPPNRKPLPSLCESCAWMREVKTPKGSRFLLCRKADEDARYAKYPPQPVITCDGFQKREDTAAAPR